MKNSDIGAKIMEYRKTNHITIKDFSDKTGLSPALISQLERNIGNPTLSALQAIAEALGITMSKLLEQEIKNEDLIVRKENRAKIVYSKNEHIVYNIVAPGPVRSKLELLVMSLIPHSETYGGFVRHDSEEEIAYVLNGQTIVEFEQEQFILYEEDSIRIMPGRKHKFINSTDKEVKVLFARLKQ